jgi:hypothetical protein
MNQTLKAAYRQTAGRVPHIGDVDRAIVTARRRRTRRAIGAPIAVASLAAVISVAAMTTPWSDDAETQPAVVESPSTSPSVGESPSAVVRVKPGSFGTTYWRLYEAAADKTWRPTVVENGKYGSGVRWFRMSGFFHGAWVEVNVWEHHRPDRPRPLWSTQTIDFNLIDAGYEGDGRTPVSVFAKTSRVDVMADLEPCEPPGCRGEGLVLTPDVKHWFVSDVKAMLQFGPPKRPW